MKMKLKKQKKEYKYVINQNEIDYKILINPNMEEYKRISSLIKNNQGFCISTEEKSDNTKCMCQKFLNKEKEGPCRCKRYTKELRADKEREKYLKSIDKNKEKEDKEEKNEKLDVQKELNTIFDDDDNDNDGNGELEWKNSLKEDDE